MSLAEEAQRTSDGLFCPICRLDHRVSTCEKFLEYIHLPVEEQHEFLLRAQGDRAISFKRPSPAVVG